MHWYDQRATKKCKIGFWKKIFMLMNNTLLWKAMVNVRNHRDIRLITTDKHRVMEYHNQIITHTKT